MGGKTVKKNILIVDEGVSFGGSLVVAARLAKGLDKEFYNPIIVTAMDISVARDHVDNEVPLYQLSKNFTYVDRARIMPSIKRLKFKLLIKVLMVLVSLFEFFVNLQYQYKIGRLIHSKSIDLVHVNNSNDAALVAFLMGIKVVQHLHGWVLPSATLSDKFYSKIPDQIIAISESVRDFYVANGGVDNKTSVIYNPIAPGLLSPEHTKNLLREELNIDTTLLTIGVYGRVVEWKGQMNFVKAIKILNDKGCRFNILVVGDDSEGLKTGYFESLKAYCADELPDQNIVFAGYVSNPELYYQITDIVVHASIEPEPFGLVIIEAMQNGAAVVVSRYGAGKELIDVGVNGFVCDPRIPEDISEKLLLLVADEAVRKGIAENGMTDVLSKYGYQQFASNVSDVYKTLLAGESR